MKKKIATLSLAAAMSLSLVGCGSKAPAYQDGEYTGVGSGLNGDIEVTVTVADGKISNVAIDNHEESETISDPAIEGIPAAIVEKNSTDVEAVAGATMTSDGIIEAVNNALESAK